VDVLGFVDFERVGLADSRKESFFGGIPKQPEHDVGGLDRVFTLGMAVLKEELDLWAESGHELKDPLELGAGRAQEQSFPVAGKFRLLVFLEQPSVDVEVSMYILRFAPGAIHPQAKAWGFLAFSINL